MCIYMFIFVSVYIYIWYTWLNLYTNAVTGCPFVDVNRRFWAWPSTTRQGETKNGSLTTPAGCSSIHVASDQNKKNRNSDQGAVGPSLHTCGSIPVTAWRRRYISALIEFTFHFINAHIRDYIYLFTCRSKSWTETPQCTNCTRTFTSTGPKRSKGAGCVKNQSWN